MILNLDQNKNTSILTEDQTQPQNSSLRYPPKWTMGPLESMERAKMFIQSEALNQVTITEMTFWISFNSPKVSNSSGTFTSISKKTVFSEVSREASIIYFRHPGNWDPRKVATPHNTGMQRIHSETTLVSYCKYPAGTTPHWLLPISSRPQWHQQSCAPYSHQLSMENAWNAPRWWDLHIWLCIYIYIYTSYMLSTPTRSYLQINESGLALTFNSLVIYNYIYIYIYYIYMYISWIDSHTYSIL